MPYLIVSLGGNEVSRHPLDGPVIIGRGSNAQIPIRDPSLSREHCRIEPLPPPNPTPPTPSEPTTTTWVVLDLTSRNGTTVNGRRISHHKLHNGDLLRVGRATLYFSTDPFSPQPRLPERPTTRPTSPPTSPSDHLLSPSDAKPLLIPNTHLARPLPGEAAPLRSTYDTIDILSSPGWSRQMREMPSPLVERGMLDSAARETSQTLDLSTLNPLNDTPPGFWQRIARTLSRIFRR